MTPPDRATVLIQREAARKALGEHLGFGDRPDRYDSVIARLFPMPKEPTFTLVDGVRVRWDGVLWHHPHLKGLGEPTPFVRDYTPSLGDYEACAAAMRQYDAQSSLDDGGSTNITKLCP